MKKIRVQLIIFISWIIFFGILSGLSNPVVFGNFTIMLVFVMVVAVFAIPQMSKIPLWAIIFFPIVILVVIRSMIGDLSSDLAIIVTVIQASSIALTTILARWVNGALAEFENAVANITLGQRETRLEPVVSGQAAIYREVRRARNHQHPLALFSISVDERTIDPVVEKLAQDIQRSMMKQYKLRELSIMLCDELEDCSVIVQDTDHYLAVLPDTKPEEIPIVVERLRQKACNQIGVEIKIGVASLPYDSYTFEGLVERAAREMQNDREPQPCIVMEQIPLEHRITQ
jgi:hypothetical protein